MEDGYIDKFDIERIVKAVETDYNIEEQERGKYHVWKAENDGSSPHEVNLQELSCSCHDFMINCSEKERKTEDTKVCKHIYRAILEVHSLL